MEGEYLVYNDFGHGYAEFGGTEEECITYKGDRQDLMVMRNRNG